MRIATVFWRKHRGEITALACQDGGRCVLKLFVLFLRPIVLDDKSNHCT